MAQDAATILRELKIHGILMVLVVMVLMTSGMLLSRYLKPFFAKWFYVHVAVFVTSLICILISVIFVFKANDNIFYTTGHTVLGLIFISGMGLQTLLGLLSHFLFDPKRSAPPAFPDQTHWWIGRVLLLVGGLTVMLGLRELAATQMAWICFYFWAVTCVIAVLYLERYIGQTHENAPQTAQDGAYMRVVDEDSKKVTHTFRVPVVLLKIAGSAGFSILLLFILVAVGIGQTA